MQYEAPIALNMNHDITPNPHYPQHNLYVPNGNGRIKSENGSDRGISPHTSADSSRYSSQTPQNQLGYNLTNSLNNGINGNMRYPSPSQQQQGGGIMPMMSNAYHHNANADQSFQQQASLGAVQQALQQDQASVDINRASTGSAGLPKAFACSTCQKGFARRSDLARHERIHSGVRPHVCDHPGCTKQFIQRSALTVHSRVHTGEKPHMCERCGKPFSDSSSLARHRRIHSGKRPYKCPYADCQKTFTRRTTLTRHQNHHTGTIEESEAATAAALASRATMANSRSKGSDDENDFSADGKSPMPQHPDRPPSVASGAGINGVASMQRQPSDFYMNAMNGGMGVPPHMRTELQPSPRPRSPSQYALPTTNAQHRPSLTSNPSAGYNPPQILEPTPNNGQNGSGNNSPHLNNTMGWQSPHHGINGNQTNDYHYADGSNGYNVNPQLYYQQGGVQRPHSTGPMDYHNQMRSADMWAQPQQ